MTYFSLFFLLSLSVFFVIRITDKAKEKTMLHLMMMTHFHNALDFLKKKA